MIVLSDIAEVRYQQNDYPNTYSVAYIYIIAVLLLRLQIAMMICIFLLLLLSMRSEGDEDQGHYYLFSSSFFSALVVPPVHFVFGVTVVNQFLHLVKMECYCFR